MAEEELSVVKLHDNFYRDSFGRVIFVIVFAVLSIALLVSVSVYLYISKPPPVTFRVAEGWRVVTPVPIQEPYLASADVLQWVSNVLPSSFNTGYMHIDEQIDNAKKYFTDNGYQVFLSQFANYIDKDTMTAYKMFSRGAPTGAPTVLNQGVLSGRYAWWVQIPIDIAFNGMRDLPAVSLKMTVLVVRAETTNNLTGILIDNVIVENVGVGNISTGPGKS